MTTDTGTKGEITVRLTPRQLDAVIGAVAYASAGTEDDVSMDRDLFRSIPGALQRLSRAWESHQAKERP